MKRFLLYLMLAACLAGVFAFVCDRFLNGSYFASRVGAAVAAEDSQLQFEKEPSFSLFPPVLTFDRIRWQGRIGSMQAEFEAAGGKIEARLFSLFLGKLEFGELNLVRPRLVLRPASSPSPVNGKPAFNLPEIDRLVAQDGAASFIGAEQTIEMRKLRLTASNLGPRREMDVQGDALLFWRPDKADSVSGNFAFQAQARYYAPNLTFRGASATFTATDDSFISRYSPLQGRLEGAVDLATLKAKFQKLSLAAPNLEIFASGEAQEGVFSGDLRFEGNLKSFSPLKAGIAGEAKLQATAKSVAISDVVFSLDGDLGQGAARIAFPSGEAVGIDLNIAMSALNLDKLKFAPHPEQGAQPPAPEFALSLWPKIQASAKIGRVNLGDYHASDLELAISGADGKYKLDQARLAWAGGAFEANGSLNFLAPLYRIKIQGQGIELAGALREAGISGFMNGLTQFKLDLASDAGHSDGALAAASGSGSLVCTGLRLDPLGEIALLLPLLGRKIPDMPVVFDEIKITFSGRNGIMDFNQLFAKGPEILGAGKARVDLASESLGGYFILNAFGFEAPFAFEGPFGEIGWKIEPDLLKKGK